MKEEARGIIAQSQTDKKLQLSLEGFTRRFDVQGSTNSRSLYHPYLKIRFNIDKRKIKSDACSKP